MRSKAHPGLRCVTATGTGVDGLGVGAGVGVSEAIGEDADDVLAGPTDTSGGTEPLAEQPLMLMTSMMDAAATTSRRRPGPKITPTR